MLQIAFDFIEEEDQRNGVIKVDIYEVKHPRLSQKYGLRYPETFTKGRYILHSTGAINIYLQKYARSFYRKLFWNYYWIYFSLFTTRIWFN